MKRYLSLFLIALMFCAVVSIGCGGGAAITTLLSPNRPRV